jgi:hypothetical protein
MMRADRSTSSRNCSVAFKTYGIARVMAAVCMDFALLSIAALKSAAFPETAAGFALGAA